ncbi:MAG: sulfatase-like hydrolase/transferase [Luteolibacter sp.]|uniref:sulfatase family protein n=1 Tax=Luteolibacter sp. TaxID=1962973 RepID=UPI0032664297
MHPIRTAYFITVFLAFLVPATGGPETKTAKPNIILLLVDDMGWGDFSCFGDKEAKTPNIDRMCAEGIRFSNFYVNSPICSPSRTGITTGQYPQRWRITSFLNNRADNKRRGMAQWLDPEAPTLARFLKQDGYATGHFGKWHMGGQRDVADAPAITRYGFDETLTNFEGMGPKLLPLTLKPGDKLPGRIWGDAERLGGPATWMQRSEITTGYLDRALEFIDKSAADKKPFYVNLWPDDVHSPFWPPVDKWANGKRGLYLSVLRQMDLQFGKLFDHIRNTPALRDNTLIVICSDNGPEPGAGTTGPFRGVKGTLYEGGTRSPLIVWGPGLIDAAKAGSHNDSSVLAAIDLAPSLLKIAGVTAPEKVAFDGEELSATFIGKETATRTKPIFWRRPPDRVNWSPKPKMTEKLPDLSVRDGNWKLLCTYDGVEPQLYDLSKDPGETKNLTGKNPEIAKRLTAAALAWHHSMPPDNGPQLGSEKGGKAAEDDAVSE